MLYEGVIKKMKTILGEPIQYYLELGTDHEYEPIDW